VSALLVGPIALGPRFKGRLGHWITTLAQHAAGDRERGPHRVDMSHVVEIDSSVALDVSAIDVGLRSGDDWVRDHIIGRIPGARHESE